MSISKIFALILALLTVFSVASAEEGVYTVDSVVVSYEMTLWRDLEIEVVDEDGNLWGYFADLDEDVHIGDIVTLTIFDFGDGEPGEILDAVCVGRLSTLEMVQWISNR